MEGDSLRREHVMWLTPQVAEGGTPTAHRSGRLCDSAIASLPWCAARYIRIRPLPGQTRTQRWPIPAPGLRVVS